MNAWDGVIRWAVIPLVVEALSGNGNRAGQSPLELEPTPLGLPAANAAEVADSHPITFRDLGLQSGLTTAPHSTTHRHYIVETMEEGALSSLIATEMGNSTSRW
jgi:hypothetical protein